MYHSFLIHSSADGHLGCFHVLAVINSAAMNIGVHVSLSDLVTFHQYFLCLFDNCCEIVSLCGFDLHFPDDEWCWAPFHVPDGHLRVFFERNVLSCCKPIWKSDFLFCSYFIDAMCMAFISFILVSSCSLLVCRNTVVFFFYLVFCKLTKLISSSFFVDSNNHVICEWREFYLFLSNLGDFHFFLLFYSTG